YSVFRWSSQASGPCLPLARPNRRQRGYRCIVSSLKEKLKRAIALTGPISVAEYMAQCLLDPEYGYYTTREPFGTQGDFITAPEVSQMFGELIGVWIFTAWQAAGSPAQPVVAEIGPG